MPKYVSNINYSSLSESPLLWMNITSLVALLLTETVVRWTFIRYAWNLDFYPALTLLGVALGGVRVRWGLSLGALSVGAVTGRWSVGVAAAVSMFVSATVCGWLWAVPSRRPFQWMSHALGVALVTLLSFSATKASFAVLFRTAPYNVSLSRSVVLMTAPALAAVLVLRLVSSWDGSTRRYATPEEVPQASRYLVAAIVLQWAGLGYLVSFGVTALRSVPTAVIQRRLGPAVATAFRATGEGRLVLLIGSLMAVAGIAFVMVEGRPDDRSYSSVGEMASE